MTVTDPFDVVNDEQMPSLRLALDPKIVKQEFKRGLPRIADDGLCKVKSISVTRYKPGRRCVIEYDCRIEQPDQKREKIIFIGKVRAKRFGNEGYRLLDEFWNAGFDAKSADGISVPEPVAVLPDFKMWLQRKVRGQSATDLFTPESGTDLAKQIATAAHKIHSAKIPVEKIFRMTDELRILRECFVKVAELKPELAARLERVSAACVRLGEKLPEPTLVGIHRDFYPAQIIVGDARLWILDFDLYCLGDAGLDIGNFLGHLTEQSLRCFGDANALSASKQALEEKFVELAGEGTRDSVRTYALLTLARHIFLSTKFEERQKLTEALLALTEERLVDAGMI